MVYLTGDTHGDPDRVRSIRKRLRGRLGPTDFLLVLGDFGFVFNGRAPETAELDRLARMRTTFLFIDGNHENFDRLEAYPEAGWNGGRVHIVRRNVLHLMRGHVFTIEGNAYFAMGGAYSQDKPWRTEGRTWWAREQPSEEEYARGMRSLAAHDHRVDFILTHAAPGETIALHGHVRPEEAPLNAYLDWVRRTTEYRGWYFGHIHHDASLWRNQAAVYEGILEIPPAGAPVASAGCAVRPTSRGTGAGSRR